MNESFSFKRFLALVEPVYWKRQLIASAVSIMIMTAFLLFRSYESSFFVLAVVILGGSHRLEFDFMSSQSGLARFFMLPASNVEKYFALLTKAIVYPLVQIITLMLVVRFISISFPNYSSNPVFRVDMFYVSIMLFIIMFCLRFVLRWNSFGVYFVIYLVLLAPLMFAETYIHVYFHTLANYPIYHGLFYILLSAAMLSFTYPQMKKLQLNRIKEKVDKL
jgi:hypothetical protein